MKVSVDGGGLGAKKGERFGNYVFSENLIKALSLYDKKNHYEIYTFDNLKPKLFWLKGRVSFEEFKEKKDIFLALNQAIPLYVSGKVISFCHGLSYYFYPQYYSKKDNIRLRNQLEEIVESSNYIIVSSNKVKEELTSIYLPAGSQGRYIEEKVKVLAFGIPFDMNNDSGQARMTSFWGAKRLQNPYFLIVGMDHPIKNIEFIREAFREFKSYRLILVTKNCSREKLCWFYRNATALLTASYYESFNLPVLEALSQSCPVIGLKSAIIPELRPYVNVVNNIDEFTEKMKTVKKPSNQLINRLNKEFNWKNYVEKLVKLY